MSEIERTKREVIPGASRELRPNPKLPPHPLDSEWHLHLDGENYGPFTGHELKEFVRDGRLLPETEVLRGGTERWVRAEDDPALEKLFGHPPARRADADSAAPSGRVSAGQGATVVQVTNNLAPPQQRAIVIDGAAKEKSPGLALFLSILIVGLGQVYNGEVGKGVLMFFGAVLLWVVMLGWIVMIWSWIDAYRTASAMNNRYKQKLAAGLV